MIHEPTTNMPGSCNINSTGYRDLGKRLAAHPDNQDATAEVPGKTHLSRWARMLIFLAVLWGVSVGPVDGMPKRLFK